MALEAEINHLKYELAFAKQALTAARQQRGVVDFQTLRDKVVIVKALQSMLSDYEATAEHFTQQGLPF